VRSGLPAVTLRCGEVEVVTGDDPVGSLTVDAFTALRVLTGRRSRAQLAELDWEGFNDPGAYFEHLVVFAIAEHDIHDAR
jgi:hypothetical protein